MGRVHQNVIKAIARIVEVEERKMSAKSQTDDCRWILKPNSFDSETQEYTPGEYCEKKVKWHWGKDDFGTAVRVYETFCEAHRGLLPLSDEEIADSSYCHVGIGGA